MSNLQRAHTNFVDEPIGNKPVTEVPGIGKVAGRNLTNSGFGTARSLLGKYLIFRDETVFKEFLMEVGGCTSRNAQAAHDALKDVAENKI